jgi:hypothetical protein
MRQRLHHQLHHQLWLSVKQEHHFEVLEALSRCTEKAEVREEKGSGVDTPQSDKTWPVSVLEIGNLEKKEKQL